MIVCPFEMLNTSNIYSHVFRMADEMAAEALDDVIFKKTSENHSA